MREHLFTSYDGALFDTRATDWSSKPLRPVYRRTFPEIRTVAQFKATLRAGEYAWPGGYPMYLHTIDGGVLSFTAARENAEQIIYAISHKQNDGWRVVACDINYEDTALYCDHGGEQIPSAYGDDGDEG